MSSLLLFLLNICLLLLSLSFSLSKFCDSINLSISFSCLLKYMLSLLPFMTFLFSTCVESLQRPFSTCSYLLEFFILLPLVHLNICLFFF